MDQENNAPQAEVRGNIAPEPGSATPDTRAQAAAQADSSLSRGAQPAHSLERQQAAGLAPAAAGRVRREQRARKIAWLAMAGVALATLAIILWPSFAPEQPRAPVVVEVLPTPGAWQRYEGYGAAITLPSSYKITFGERPGVLAGTPRSAWPTPSPLTAIRGPGSRVRAMMMLWDESASNKLSTLVNISQEDYAPGAADDSLAQLLQDVITRCLCARGTIISQEVVELPSGSAGRGIYETRIGESYHRSLVYVFKASDGLWVVNFGVAEPYFEQLQPIFERAIESFEYYAPE
jgi:hypothetical protein